MRLRTTLRISDGMPKIQTITVCKQQEHYLLNVSVEEHESAGQELLADRMGHDPVHGNNSENKLNHTK